MTEPHHQALAKIVWRTQRVASHPGRRKEKSLFHDGRGISNRVLHQLEVLGLIHQVGEKYWKAGRRAPEKTMGNLTRVEPMKEPA